LAEKGFDAALLLPNSFHSAWVAWRARIGARWGYRGDGRAPLLTTAVRRPVWPYRQVEYYQHLTRTLGFASDSSAPEFVVPASVTDSARELLEARGHRSGDRLVVMAPGTAQSTSKQWIPEYVSALVAQLSQEGVRCVLAGAAGDMDVARRILSAIPEPARSRTIDVVGQTTLEQLVGLLKIADVVVGNDSGATHLAAGLGTRVVATFGPTNEAHSAPLGHPDAPAVVLTHQVWCRPCMLMKECPIDHSCMTGLTPDRVHRAVLAHLS
jgi:heptosyltransferase-2